MKTFHKHSLLLGEKDDLLVNLINEIIQYRNEDIEDNPDFLTWDWDDRDIIYQNSNAIFNILTFNALIPDKAITTKINSSKIIKSISKWNASFSEILNELLRLQEQFPEFNVNTVLYNIICYIRINVMKLIENAINDIQSKIKKNDLDLEMLIRNRKRSKKIDSRSELFLKNIKHYIKGRRIGKKTKNPFIKIINKTEEPINRMLQNIFAAIIKLNENKLSKLKANKLILGIATGNSHAFMRMLPLENLNHYGTNNVYRNLFPLFKQVIKDKILLSEEAFHNQNKVKYDCYDRYMISQIKIILGKT